MTATPGQIAMVNWLLANGEYVPGNHYDPHTTLTVLADLAERGVDYDATGTPGMQSTLDDPGDSINDATFVQAFGVRVLPNHRAVGAYGPKDAYEFAIPGNMLLGALIQSVAALVGGDGEPWRERAAVLAEDRRRRLAR